MTRQDEIRNRLETFLIDAGVSIEGEVKLVDFMERGRQKTLPVYVFEAVGKTFKGLRARCLRAKTKALNKERGCVMH